MAKSKQKRRSGPSGSTKAKKVLGGSNSSQPSAPQIVGIVESSGTNSETTELHNSSTAEFAISSGSDVTEREEEKKSNRAEEALSRVPDEQPKTPLWIELFLREHWKKIVTVLASFLVAILGTVFVIGRWTGTIESNIAEIKQGVNSNKDEVSQFTKELRNVVDLIGNQKRDIQKVMSEVKDNEVAYENIRASMNEVEKKQTKTETEVAFIKRDVERLQDKQNDSKTN